MLNGDIGDNGDLDVDANADVKCEQSIREEVSLDDFGRSSVISAGWSSLAFCLIGSVDLVV